MKKLLMLTSLSITHLYSQNEGLVFSSTPLSTYQDFLVANNDALWRKVGSVARRITRLQTQATLANPQVSTIEEIFAQRTILNSFELPINDQKVIKEIVNQRARLNGLIDQMFSWMRRKIQILNSMITEQSCFEENVLPPVNQAQPRLEPEHSLRNQMRTLLSLYNALAGHLSGDDSYLLRLEELREGLVALQERVQNELN